MTTFTTIELDKEYLKFSAAHFTIFSATERERLHGHNFSVAGKFVAPVDDNGMCFRYAVFKEHLRQLCKHLDEFTLLAARSPFLSIEQEGRHYRVSFADEDMLLLQAETLLLPIRNTTVEELSRYLLERLRSDDSVIADNHVREIEISVASGPGQRGISRWSSIEQHDQAEPSVLDLPQIDV